MDKTVSAGQLEVLRWIVDGCPEGTWPPGDFRYKSAANALQNRRLVVVQKVPPPWRAEATAAGRFYAENGTYPEGHKFSEIDLTPVVRLDGDGGAAPVSASPRAAPPVKKRPAKERPEKEPVAAPTPRTRLKNASGRSPIVRVLRKNPHWLEVPTAFQPRMLRIAQHLSDEALRMGWEVILPEHPAEGWNGWHHSSRRKLEFITLNAGHEPVEILARTFKDARAPGLRLRIEAGRLYSVTRKIEDTKTTFVEDKLDSILDFVAHLSLREQKLAAEREVIQREWERERQEAAELAERAKAYTSWRDAFVERETKWVAHRQTKQFLAEFVERMEGRGSAEQKPLVDAYIEWAKRYVEESDPLSAAPLPPEQVPDMTYQEWVQSQANPRWRGYGR